MSFCYETLNLLKVPTSKFGKKFLAILSRLNNGDLEIEELDRNNIVTARSLNIVFYLGISVSICHPHYCFMENKSNPKKNFILTLILGVCLSKDISHPFCNLKKGYSRFPFKFLS